MKRTNKVWTGAVGCIVLAILMVTGCGAKRLPPHDVMANAEMSINRAREADAMVYAPLELKFAEEKIAKAKDSMSREDYEAAYRFAEDAILDAQVAEAKSRAAKAKELSQKMQENNNLMRSEIERTP